LNFRFQTTVGLDNSVSFSWEGKQGKFNPISRVRDFEAGKIQEIQGMCVVPVVHPFYRVFYRVKKRIQGFQGKRVVPVVPKMIESPSILSAGLFVCESTYVVCLTTNRCNVMETETIISSTSIGAPYSRDNNALKIIASRQKKEALYNDDPSVSIHRNLSCFGIFLASGGEFHNAKIYKSQQPHRFERPKTGQEV